VRCDDLRFRLGVVVFLQRITCWMEGRVWVFYHQVMLGKLMEASSDGFYAVCCGLESVSIPRQSAFHLVENRIVTAVDGVTPVHVGGNGITIAGVGTKNIYFVCGCVRSQESVLVDVVGVCSIPPGVISGEP